MPEKRLEYGNRMSVYQAITSRHSTCVLTPILPQHIRKSLTYKAFNNSFRFKVFTLLQAKLHTPRERSEVSFYIICIMAYKVSLYFIDGFKIALIMASHSNLLHKWGKYHFGLFNCQRTNKKSPHFHTLCNWGDYFLKRILSGKSVNPNR